MPNKILFWTVALLFIIIRTWFGAQINFHHADYNQIYLMGIQYVTEPDWSFWGPDVVWSKTRLAGGLQPLLVGLPLQLFKHPITPFILSNIISSFGLILISLYSSYRLKLSKLFVLCFVMTLPFFFFHGSVVLNTAYLLLPGALLFISIFELYLYRNETLLKNIYWYFFTIGFCLFFVYQLHLTWVTILPYTVVLYFLEWQRKESSTYKIILYFLLGSFFSAITLIPTVWNYHDLLLNGVSENLSLNLEKSSSVIELFTRYIGYTTYDLSPNFRFYGLASDQNTFVTIALYALKFFGILQIIFLIIILWLSRGSKTTKHLIILFVLTLIMNLFLYVIGNKHLESRTYILLYALPIFMYLYAISQLKSKKWLQITSYTLVIISLFSHITVGFYNYQNIYSIHPYKEKIKKSLDLKDYHQFGERRKTKMD